MAALPMVLVAISGARSGQDQGPLPAEFRDATGGGAEFPLKLGYRWTYKVDGRDQLFLETLPGQEFSGTKTVLLLAQGGSFFWSKSLFLAVKDGNLLKYASAYLDSVFPDEPPHVLLKTPLRIGLRWESLAEKQESQSSFKFTSTVVSQEDVKVPAGEFKAWKIEYVLDWHLGTEEDLRAWYVPGIGFVKVEKWRQSTLGKKSPLQKQLVYELARIEPLKDAHLIDFPTPPKPIEQLPKHVQAPRGKLTLFADYNDVWQGNVVLYLVNDTDKPATFPAEGTDIYVKLEALGEDGRWHRAQSHVFSWCGNSYHELTLAAGQFIQLLGWLPEKGVEHEVRYKFYSEVDLVSNAGKSLVSLEELQRVRYDAMSIKDADITVIQELLFEDVGLPERLKERPRRAAIMRLGELPREQSLPVVERLLESKNLSELDYRESASVLSKLAPDLLQTYAKKLISEGSPQDQQRILKELPLLSRGDDAELRSMLIEQLKNPRAPNLRWIISHLASLRLPEVKELLGKIKSNKAYPADVRIRARYERERCFGEDVLQLSVELGTDLDDRFFATGPLVVSLSNKSGKALTFDYEKPSDIISLYLQFVFKAKGGEYEDRFLSPRPGVVWFRKSRGPQATKVKLEPGETYQVNMNLFDYFDLPQNYEPRSSFLTLWVSCALPGVHQVPQLCSIGRGIRIQRAR
jgi:hypothetical protein